MALLVHVWETCRAQLTAQEKNRSDSKCGTEHATMKAAVEVFNGRLTDKELPSKSLVAQKLEQVEDNALYAEDTRDVTSAEDAEGEGYNAVIDPSAAVLRIKPGRTTATPPGNPEELRLRHRRIGLAWEMVRAKHFSCAWLPERCMDAFRRLSDHVLGSRVAGLRSGDGQEPCWKLVLKYEAEVRKLAYRLIRDGEAPDLALSLVKSVQMLRDFDKLLRCPIQPGASR